MPTEERGDKIGGAEDIKAAAQDRAGDAIQSGENPGHLGAVDAEMGGDGSVKALGYEDRAGVGLGRCLRGCGSVDGGQD